MTESLLCADICEWLRMNALGNANAVPRRVMLGHLHAQGHSVDDRGMRKAYEGMDKVGSCARGLFWVVTAEDRRIAGKQLHGRAMSELVRERRIREAAPQGQGELFT